jgi:hypothetical protein
MDKMSETEDARADYPQPVMEEAGRPIETAIDSTHLSLLHLKSGLGMVYGPRSRWGAALSHFGQ